MLLASESIFIPVHTFSNSFIVNIHLWPKGRKEGLEAQWGKNKRKISYATNTTYCTFSLGGELFMQLEKEGIFMEDTAWYTLSLVKCYLFEL